MVLITIGFTADCSYKESIHTSFFLCLLTLAILSSREVWEAFFLAYSIISYPKPAKSSTFLIKEICTYEFTICYNFVLVDTYWQYADTHGWGADVHPVTMEHTLILVSGEWCYQNEWKNKYSVVSVITVSY